MFILHGNACQLEVLASCPHMSDVARLHCPDHVVWMRTPGRPASCSHMITLSSKGLTCTRYTVKGRSKCARLLTSNHACLTLQDLDAASSWSRHNPMQSPTASGWLSDEDKEQYDDDLLQQFEDGVTAGSIVCSEFSNPMLVCAEHHLARIACQDPTCRHP
jgi:hypothetical protein